MSQSEDAESSGGMDRRKVLKGAVAAGAGAVVWAEPTIRGLARRPAYAAAGTPQTFVVPSTSWRNIGNATGTGLPLVVWTDGPLTLTLFGPEADGSHSDTGPIGPAGTYTFTAVAPGCTCEFTDAKWASLRRFNDNNTRADGVLNPLDPSIIEIDWTAPTGEIANRFRIRTNLEVFCTPI